MPSVDGLVAIQGKVLQVFFCQFSAYSACVCDSVILVEHSNFVK